MLVVFLEWAQYASLNLRETIGVGLICCSRLVVPRRCPFPRRALRSRPTSFRAVELRCEPSHSLLPFSAVHFYSIDVLCISWCRTGFGNLALYPLHFGIHAAGLLHLPHTWMRSQVSLGTALQLAVK